MKTKNCPKCGMDKSLSDFDKDRTRKDGLNNKCKTCYKLYKQKHYQSHKENISRKHKKYRRIHKKQLKQKAKRYRDSHKKERKEYDKIYRQINKKEILERKKNYEKRRRKNDINYKILCNMRTRINKAVKENSKSLSTMFLIGCEIEYLMYYIQCKFTKGMNWDNYGKWHIDHIRPCALFDLSKASEQHKCFNYTNLQPLWAVDNHKKGSKYTEPETINRKSKENRNG